MAILADASVLFAGSTGGADSFAFAIAAKRGGGSRRFGLSDGSVKSSEISILNKVYFKLQEFRFRFIVIP